MKNSTIRRLLNLAMIPTLGWATAAHATLIVDSVTDGSASAYSANVSSIDLLNGLAPESQSGTWSAGGTAVLTDGAHGGEAEIETAAWALPNAVVTYDLGVGSGFGWDLTSIRTIASWPDAGFGSQDFTIEIEGVVGGGFSLLTTQEYQPIGYNNGGSTQITLTESGGLLASGVQKIRLTQNFNDDAVAGWDGSTVLRELDVFGTQTAIPEPSSLMLLLGGCVTVLIAARRK